MTSVIFLAAILVTVVHLTRSRSDVIEADGPARTPRAANPARERIMLGYYAFVATWPSLRLPRPKEPLPEAGTRTAP
ncbi:MULTISPECIES: hypothetical protein [unclassified Kitasatospora]|uniref:hypothetical protein n=1 Tax=unclassified Kitasatospora TaxID=2633591 RepID=UPI0033CF1EDB